MFKKKQPINKIEPDQVAAVFSAIVTASRACVAVIDADRNTPAAQRAYQALRDGRTELESGVSK